MPSHGIHSTTEKKRFFLYTSQLFPLYFLFHFPRSKKLRFPRVFRQSFGIQLSHSSDPVHWTSVLSMTKTLHRCKAPGCEYSSTRPSQLKRHCRIHSGDKVRSVKCNFSIIVTILMRQFQDIYHNNMLCNVNIVTKCLYDGSIVVFLVVLSNHVATIACITMWILCHSLYIMAPMSIFLVFYHTMI